VFSNVPWLSRGEGRGQGKSFKGRNPICRFGRSRRKAQKLMDELERCSFCGAGVEVYAQSCPACGHDLVEEKIAVFRKQRDME
jgi:hypothetical protein